MCSDELLKYLQEGQPIGIDLDRERPIPIDRAGHLRILREGRKRPHDRSVIQRWSRNGRGPLHVRLETVMTGGGLCTTREAVNRFLIRWADSLRPRRPMLAKGDVDGLDGGVLNSLPASSPNRRPTSAAASYLDQIGLLAPGARRSNPGDLAEAG